MGWAALMHGGLLISGNIQEVKTPPHHSLGGAGGFGGHPLPCSRVNEHNATFL